MLCIALGLSAAGCARGTEPPDEFSGTVEEFTPQTGPEEQEQVPDLSYREARSFEELPHPPSTVDEGMLPAAPEGAVKERMLLSEELVLEFFGEGGYSVRLRDGKGEVAALQEPAEVYIGRDGSDAERLSSKYTLLRRTDYGYCASARLTSTAGSRLLVEDFYYFPKEGIGRTFNVARQVTIQRAAEGDGGFESVFSISSKGGEGHDWFIPNNQFSELSDGTYTYRETHLGLPMIMMRGRETGISLSLARYQPVIHYEGDGFASLSAVSSEGSGEIRAEYPSADGARRFHALQVGASHAFTLSLRADRTQSHNEAIVSSYNAHFLLQNQRIVATDINEVYRVVLEDYKTFFRSTLQTDGKGGIYTSYGLPWSIEIESGEIGPLTYQAGFIGQQLPAAYNMMLYGIMKNDRVSLQNGINVLDFWVNDAKFMTPSGVPHIWFDTWANGFRPYPCFLRMGVDAMEGLFDAYRLAQAHGIEREEWYAAVRAFADFLVRRQNADGSWYRCYNYDGLPFKDGDNGIPEPANNICQSESKLNTALPVRFLAKMYEFSGEEKYRAAALSAGEFVYETIYPTHVYSGGTCDNPNRVDKESGVYAMYCYDALYMLTRDKKWLPCLEQATAFTMSTVQVFSYPVRRAGIKAGKPVEYGYTDGMSFICVGSVNADNYIAYLYYELFRVYILTGEKCYLKMAEFVQQNTKSIMDWDGALGYPYKSLVAEASTTADFDFYSVGTWVTWSSVANIEPISKMLTGFGEADVGMLSALPRSELLSALETIGVGGKPHPVYKNTVVSDMI